MRSPEDNQQINRFLRFKSRSAPTSPRSSAAPSPNVFPQYRGSDIPLLELTPHTPDPRPTDSRPGSSDTVVEEEQKRQFTDTGDEGKKEAARLVREHTKRGNRPTSFFRRISLGDRPRSGASTPEEDHFGKQHYQFNSGVLTNLLKLYFPSRQI